MTEPRLRAVPQPTPLPAPHQMTDTGIRYEQLELARARTELLRQLTAVAAAGFVLAATALVATAGRWAVVALRR